MPWYGSVLLAVIPAVATGLFAWLIARSQYRSAIERLEKQVAHEREKERRQAVRQYRERRVEPVIEALDRAMARWDWESLVELSQAIGYSGENVEGGDEERKQRQHEAQKRLFEEVQRDISAARTIPDHELRRFVVSALWRSTDRESYDEKLSLDLGEAYRRLEDWMFGP